MDKKYKHKSINENFYMIITTYNYDLCEVCHNLNCLSKNYNSSPDGKIVTTPIPFFFSLYKAII